MGNRMESSWSHIIACMRYFSGSPLTCCCEGALDRGEDGRAQQASFIPTRSARRAHGHLKKGAKVTDEARDGRRMSEGRRGVSNTASFAANPTPLIETRSLADHRWARKLPLALPRAEELHSGFGKGAANGLLGGEVEPATQGLPRVLDPLRHLAQTHRSGELEAGLDYPALRK